MGEDLTGKRIVVWGEQGIGDQLLFLTLLPIVLSKNPEEVVVEVSKKIIPLVQRWYPEVTVQPDGIVDTIGHQNYETIRLQHSVGDLDAEVFSGARTDTDLSTVDARSGDCAEGNCFQVR